LPLDVIRFYIPSDLIAVSAEGSLAGLSKHSAFHSFGVSLGIELFGDEGGAYVYFSIHISA
jgi:hypothetical protein